MANNVILPQLQRQPTGLEQFSTGLGNSIGAGIQNLLSLKTQQLQQRHGLEALGYTPKEAAGLSNLSPESLREVIKQKIQQPSQQAYLESLQSLLGTPSQQAQPESLQQFLGQAQQQPQQSSILGKPGLTAQQATKLAELGLKKQEISRREQHEIQKETKPIYDEILKEAKSAKETKLSLDKMEKLINRGKLPPAALYKVIKDIQEKLPSSHGAAAGGAVGLLAGGPIGAVIGGGLGSLINPIASLVESGLKSTYPDTEQFEKLSNSMVRGAKALFGNRITNLDLQTFLSTIPNLTQTENGKRQIIKNIKIFNEAAEVRAKVLKDILKENQGKRPANLGLLVEERANEELDKLAEEFISA